MAKALWIRCRDCSYWDTGEDPRLEADGGLCRKLAPTARLDPPGEGYPNDNAAAIWPMTTPTAGCGEGKT